MAWLVVRSECENTATFEDAVFINVVPDFGKEHTLSPDCWCEPEVEWADAEAASVIHNECH